MDRVYKLLGVNDIYDIHYNTNSFELSFSWEMDCGCFSIDKYSHLIIQFQDEMLDKVIDNMTNLKGKIGAYILNHKEYNGALLEIKGDELVD